MAGNWKCIICRHNLPQKDNDRFIKSTDEEKKFNYWKNECGESLCQVLLGSVAYPYFKHFQLGEYCEACLQTARDIDFTWREIKCLQNRLNLLSTKIQSRLKCNYGNIPKKTDMEIVERRMLVALAGSTEEDAELIHEKYSYDEIVEIVYTAIVLKTETGEDGSFSGTMPFKIKIEQEAETDREEVEVEFQINGEEDETSDLELEFGTNNTNSNIDVEDSVMKANSPILEGSLFHCIAKNSKRRTSSEMSETSPVVDNDEDFNLSNTSEESDDNLSDASYTVDEDHEDQNNEDEDLNVRINRKGARKIPRSRNSSKQVKCPICHKIVSKVNAEAHSRIHTGERPFPCLECDKFFKDVGSLRKHTTQVHGKLPQLSRDADNPHVTNRVANDFASRNRCYYCDFCSWGFNQAYRYLRHLKDKHLNKDIKDGHAFYFYYCDGEDCTLSFTSLSSLRKHISDAHLPPGNTDEEKSIPECNVCKMIFAQETNLESHMKSHEENNFGCEYCYMNFSTEDELDLHKPRHEIVFRLSAYCHLCEDCGEGFTDVNMLRKHTLTLHLEDDSNTVNSIQVQDPQNTQRKRSDTPGTNTHVFCTVCMKGIHTTSLENHMFTHSHPNGFQCSKCPEVRKTPKSLQFHERRAHPQPSHPNPKIPKTVCNKRVCSKSQEMPSAYFCPHCDIIKSTAKHLEYHIKRSHPPDQFDVPEIFKGSQTKCDVCNVKYENRTMYRRHLINCHPEKYKSTHPHVCRFCWCVFQNKKDQTLHVEKNHNSFICTVKGCTKKFVSKQRLTAHLNVHNNLKPYVCPFCQKGFANDGNCISHVNMVHIKHRSFRCKLCPKNQGYFVRKEFNKHVSNTHPKISENEYNSVLDYHKAPAPTKINKNKL